MKRNIIKIFTLTLLAAAAMAFVSCRQDKLDPESIYTEDKTPKSEFDKWLEKNYVIPYNVQFNWKYNDNETNMSYNVVPCDSSRAVALAIMIKHMWYDAYGEVVGNDFLKTNSPRVLSLIGSLMYSGQGSVILGYAENGVKVNLFNVNAINIDDPYVNVDDWYYTQVPGRTELNHWFFHVMHHEFCHILQQTRNYNVDFDLVSAADYKAGDWVNLDDEDAPVLGFVSGYASDQAREDFAEIYSLYVTISETAWNNLVNAAVDADGNTAGRDAILTKLEYVRDYMKGWGIDMDEMRAVVLRRSNEIQGMDLRKLN